MARHEQDREDLMAEATALVERVSLLLPGHDVATVAGFRRDGSLAIYFAPECVYQFTSNGTLRRAFLGELLYKAKKGALVSLQRERCATAVHLVSQTLDADATQAFLSEMQTHLKHLTQSLSSGDFTLIESVSPAGNVLQRVLDWLRVRAECITIARSPRSS